MEFCAEFAVLQGTLISAQRNFGSLNALTRDDAHSIAAIIEATKTVLQSISEENSDAETENCLRKVHLFLVLNSDLSVRDSLMDDMNCGHIVGCTPVMSMHLLVELVWGLSLQKYFFETIMFSPPSLGVELLSAAAHAIKLLQPKTALQAVDGLCRSAYVRALTLPDSQDDSQIAIHQLFVCYKTILNYFQENDVESLRNFSNKELHMYAGHTMEKLLNLLDFCIAQYLVGAPDKELPQMYDLVCPWDKSTDMMNEYKKQITVEDFNKVLLSVCKCNLNHVTIDEWLEWVEFTADCDNTKTQQCVLAEKMYICKERLHALKQPDDVITELITMLSSMARKPRDEEDEIKEANIEEIVQNVLSPSRSRGKWLKALLRLDDALKNDQSVSCLEDNLDLVDGEDAETILHLVVSQLEHCVDNSQCDRLRCLALSAVHHVDVDTQIKILENFLGKTDSESTILLSRNFKDKVTEALNKAIAASREFDKFLSDCICLCLESPCQVVEQLLNAGISNSSQGRMVVRVLGRLGIVCNMPCGGSCEPLLLSSIMNFMLQHQDWSDSQKENFTKFVTSVAKRDIMDSSVFMQRCLLPALHTSLVEKLWSSVLLWLQTLQSLVANVHFEANHACLIVILSQVIEASQWNMFTFSLEVVHVHERAVQLLNTLIDAMDMSNGSQVKWLQSKLLHFSALVWSYLAKVWNPWTVAGSHPCDLSMILFYLAHGRNEHAITTVQTSKYSRLEWVLALVEVLPMMTASEWDLLTENLAVLNPGPLSVFYLVSDALLFIFTAITDIRNQAVVSCVEYLFRNFGVFVKNFVLPVINADHEDSAVQVFEKCIELLMLVPVTAEESTMLQFSNILTEIISIVMCSGNKYVQKITRSIEKLHEGDMKQALTLKLHMENVETSISAHN